MVLFEAAQYLSFESRWSLIIIEHSVWFDVISILIRHSVFWVHLVTCRVSSYSIVFIYLISIHEYWIVPPTFNMHSNCVKLRTSLWMVFQFQVILKMRFGCKSGGCLSSSRDCRCLINLSPSQMWWGKAEGSTEIQPSVSIIMQQIYLCLLITYRGLQCFACIS